MNSHAETRYFTLSKKEKELMDLFWDAEIPLGRTEILEHAAQRECSWKPNSVHILMNSLLEKGALRVAGYYMNSRKLGRTFEPNLSPLDYALLQVDHTVRLAAETGATREALLSVLDRVLGKA